MFTIVTVCQDSLKGLQRTAASLAGWNSGEWLIIDGASEDGTVEWLRQTDTLWPNRRWFSAPDDGLYQAMNRGVSRSQGQWIIFLNAGDCWSLSRWPQAETQVMRCTSPLLAFDLTWVDARCRPRYLRTSLLPGRYWDILGTPAFHPALISHRSLFENFGGFREDLKISADYEWLLRLARHGFRPSYCSDWFSIFEEGGVSTSVPKSQLMIEDMKALAYQSLPAWQMDLALRFRQARYSLGNFRRTFLDYHSHS